MTWFLIVGMAFITFLNRYAFLTNTIKYEPSEQFKRLLRYSSYSVLTAIWAPIVFQMNGHLKFSIAGMDYVVACSLAAIMTFFRLPSLLTVITSTTVFFVFRFMF